MLEAGAPVYALGAVQGFADDLTLTGGARLVGAGTEEEIGAGLRRSVRIGYGVGVPMVLVSATIVVLNAVALIRG